MAGRPRTAIGTYGSVWTVRVGSARYSARTRYRDLDGRLRQVAATDSTRNSAIAELKKRVASRPGYGSGGLLGLSSPFGDLCSLWLAELDGREISDGTKKNYRDDLRTHVRPFFDNYNLGEITTGRVEAFLQQERAISYSRAKHSRTVLSLMFGYAPMSDPRASRFRRLNFTSLFSQRPGLLFRSCFAVRELRHAAASFRRECGPRPGRCRQPCT